MILQAIAFGLTVAFMIVGLVGILLPILPGTVLIWLSVLVYAIFDGFKAIDWAAFAVISLIALVTGTADIWLSLIGAQRSGAARRSLLLGAVGAIAGFFILGAVIPILGSLLGGVLGYALGVLLGQYHKYRDWNIALRASLGGLAGWGLATAVQLGGGLLIMLIFIWQVLAY
ncbi:MAG: DUF456 family protein [Candidatus Promineifilaceae bacterium]